MLFHAITDPGLVRRNNEDCIYARQSALSPERGVFIVADGVGGQNAGEVASRICCQYIGDNILEWLDTAPLTTGFSDAVKKVLPVVESANQKILEHMQTHPECRGMGSTLTACIFLGRKPDSDLIRCVVVNQGDSVCFAIGKKITRISKEHTVIADLLASGKITPEEAKTHPLRKVITHAMGMNPMPRPDIFKVEVKRHVQILLATDGLLNHIPDDEIFTMVTPHADVKSACESLVSEANRRGGSDNISVIIVRRDDYTPITII